MFQTDINHFFQSYDTYFIQQFMQWISDMGTRTVYLASVMFILFVLDFRKGFIALQCLLWANFFTNCLKEWLHQPRPYHVDASLKVFEDVGTQVRLNDADAPSFFAKLPRESVSAFQGVEEFDPGFPSGHTSTAVAFWLSLGIQSKARWFILLTALFVLLTMISRLYLGMHFIADVTGGLLLGFTVLALVLFVFQHGRIIASWASLQWYKNKYWYLAMGIPPVLMILPNAPVSTLGQLSGISLGTWFVCKAAFPNSKAAVWKRLSRFVLAVIIFILIDIFMSRFVPKSELPLWVYVRNTVQFFGVFYLALWLNKKLNLFEKPVY
ncbi:MAG: phosphatase PAP2 family protein [Salinivirgaceae bacterium]|nr:phosphatase PAP2 family protein [Salinivirgaceae bacterium]